MHKPFMVYDAEIKKGILGKRDQPEEGIEYCAGWDDHANMGISVMGAYTSWDDRFRVFMDDNAKAFIEIMDNPNIIKVGFNSIGFDDKLINATPGWGGLHAPGTHYDILRELWLADGLGPEFKFPSHIGYGLDAVAKANFPGQVAKTGHGAQAPMLWQRGQIGEVVDYCLQDVRLTLKVLLRILETGGLRSPKAPGKFLELDTTLFVQPEQKDLF
jgi:hypothetical protein